MLGTNLSFLFPPDKIILSPTRDSHYGISPTSRPSLERNGSLFP